MFQSITVSLRSAAAEPCALSKAFLSKRKRKVSPQSGDSVFFLTEVVKFWC